MNSTQHTNRRSGPTTMRMTPVPRKRDRTIRSVLIRCCLRIVVGAAMALGAGQASALETLSEIAQCVNANTPQRTFSQMLGISAFDRIGVERRMIARMFGERGDYNAVNLMIIVDRPEDLAGARYLVRSQEGPDDIYMFLPALGVTKKVTGESANSKLWGTDFSYEDLLQIFGSFLEGRQTRRDDSSFIDRETYVVDVEPFSSEGTRPYARIITDVDQQTCLALRVRFYDESETLKKQLTLNPDVISRENGRFVGHEYTMEDRVQKTRTILYLGDVIYAEEQPEGAFSPRSFRYVE